MAWYNASWTYRQKITMNAALIDEVFQVLPIAGSELGSDFFDDAKSDGGDIRFTQADGTTELACHILSHDSGTDTGRYFVDVSSVSNISTDVDIYVYYGNAGASAYAANATYGADAVWGSHAGVYFPGHSLLDYTDQASGWALTAVGSPGTTASGFEGVTAATYSGSGQYHHYSSTTVTPTPASLESLCYATNTTTGGGIVSLASSAGATNNYFYLVFRGDLTNDPIRFPQRGNGGSIPQPVINNYTATTWHYIAASRDALVGTSRLFYDGTSATDTTTLSSYTTVDRLSIGTNLGSVASLPLNGRFAFAAVSAVDRSANYFTTTHNSWANASFISASAQETDTSSGNTGIGALAGPAGTLSGSGVQRHVGTGALTGPAGTVSGTGVSSVPVNGTGALDAPMPLISADGDIVSGDQDLVGDLTVAAGVIQGTGITSRTGTAPLIAPKPIVSGLGGSTISGTGALTAPSTYGVSGGAIFTPDISGTAGLVAPAPALVSGEGFVLETGDLPVDSIAWYLTGASAAGKSQRDQSLSLGGFRSGVSIKSMTWDCRQPMVGVEILGVGALNGRGTGSLEAITDNSLRWTPPGGVAGTTVALAQGQEAKLFGFESGAWIMVRRNSTLPMVGIHSVQCVDVYNNAIGFDNVSSADAIAGEVFYRAVMGKNEFAGPMTELKIWLDEDANSGIAIGFEFAVNDEIQDVADETTAPTGISWVTGTTSATGISIPAIAAGDSFGLWIRKTIAADSDPSPSELVHIHIQYGDLVPTTRLDDLRGKYRIAREDYETYGLWLGQDAQPDLDAAADEEFTTRPHTTVLSLDPDHVYYAVVRQRNKWGLWSQNTTATALPMLADGEQGFVAPHGPSAVAITQSGDNYPIFSARYEPSQDTILADLTRNDPGRAEIFVLWYTRDDSAPDPTDPPSAYGLMGTRAGVETLKYTETGTAFLDETPVKALVRTRRLAIGAGTRFSPDTTQLPASGAGTIVVASEITGWESSGYLKVTTFSGSLQEVVEYSSLVVGAGISTFTVGSGGRGLWGTTAAATVTNNVIYPITPVDSENEDITEYTIDGIAPGRPWGELLFGTDAAQEQDPIEGPDGATEEYISVPNDHYLLLGEGWCELWMGSDLVWKVFQDGNAPTLNGLYIPSEWTVASGAISGAGTGVFDSVASDSLYIVAGSVRRVHINSTAMTITMPDFSTTGGIPEVAPQSSTWEQYAGTLLQSWDPERQDYRPYAQLTTAGLLTSQWTVYNDLTQAEIVAL